MTQLQSCTQFHALNSWWFQVCITGIFSKAFALMPIECSGQYTVYGPFFSKVSMATISSTYATVTILYEENSSYQLSKARLALTT